MRKRLLDLDGVAETAAWYGASWKWSLEYRLPGRAEPVALLVPSPTDLQLAIPFQRDVVHELSRRPMKRAIRDGLELALDPFHTRWGVWSITVLLHEDLWKLIELKVSRTGTAKPPIQKRSRATVQAR